MDNDISLLRRCIEDRSPILLLGAGFSLGAKGRNGQKLMLGGALAQRLYEEIIIPNKDLLTEEALDTASLAIKWGNLFAICNVIRENNLTTQRDTLFQEWMSECTYNDAPYFSNLIKVDWKYIFTLNINYIKQINDFIDVLYVAHHGKRFSEYFDSWMKLRDTDKQFPVFQSVTLLTTVGIPDISINYLPEMAASLKIYNFNYPQFIQSFGEFCSDEDGLLRLRCSRLFSSVVLGNLTIDAKAIIIRNLVYELSKDLKEGDRTCNNEIFKHLIRASSLTKIVGLDKQRAIDFLI